MNKDRNTKIIIAITLIIAVAGLSLGFAAFSTTLTITSKAHVNPGNNMNVVFVSTAGEENVQVAGTLSGEGSGTDTNFKADNATITDTTITGLKAYFTKAGQSVTYKFKVKNKTENPAYLNSVVGQSTPLSCAANEGTNQDLVDQDCENVTISLKLANSDAVFGSAPKRLLDAGATEDVEVTISYAGATHADGDFEVTFKDINLVYGTASGYTGN